jgi:hypothetical protein
MSLPEHNRLVVVLGMHRSGTSAVTRALTALGVDLGERLMPPVEGQNPKGYFEDIDVVHLNQRLVAALGTDWDTLSPVSPRDVEMLRSREFFLDAIELVREKTGGAHRVVGFKDPRLSRLMPFWQAVFAYLELTVSYVVVIRNPVSVARSLARRDQFDATKSYLLWLAHVIEALAATVESGPVLIDYDALMASPDREVRKLSRGLALPLIPARWEDYKSEFLAEDLRHNRAAPGDSAIDDACPPLAREVYAALSEVAAKGQKTALAELPGLLPAWQAELARVAAVVRLLDRQAASLAELPSLRGGIADRDARIAELEGALSQQDARMAELYSAVSVRDERLAQLDAEVAKLVALVALRDEQAQGLNHGLVARDARLKVLGEMVGQRDSQLEVLQRDIGTRDARVGELGRRIGELEELLAGSNGALRDRDARLHELTNSVMMQAEQINALTQALGAQVEKNEQLTGVLNDHKAQLQAGSATIDSLTRELQGVLASRWWRLGASIRLTDGTPRQLLPAPKKPPQSSDA